jgi:dTDP-glucose 4,6-dehydratase/UDP-glucose 4-epimerase
MSNLRILIIGSEGFIGSNIFRFLDRYNEVHSCDFVDVRGKLNYFQIYPLHQNYLDIFSLNNYDVAINCAGSANVGASLLNPSYDFDANVHVVAKLLSAILESKQRTRLVNISSAAVYGNPETLPIFTEYAEKATPISPYGVHKRITEILLENYFKSFNVPTCSLRLFSVYGNGQRKLLLWDLYKKFSENDSVELFGSGKESRDYIHIDDICQQIELVLKNANFNGEAYNIANGEEVFIKDVAGLFSSCFQNRKFEFNGVVREGDPLNWKADIQRMKEWGYQQKVTLQEGVYQFIKWAQENA